MSGTDCRILPEICPGSRRAQGTLPGQETSGLYLRYAARPDEIVHQPRNDFVRKFILRQLEIKRGNIYALFGDRPQLAGEAV